MPQKVLLNQENLLRFEKCNFRAKNLFDIENEVFDVTFCIGTFQIFHDMKNRCLNYFR